VLNAKFDHLITLMTGGGAAAAAPAPSQDLGLGAPPEAMGGGMPAEALPPEGDLSQMPAGMPPGAPPMPPGGAPPAPPPMVTQASARKGESRLDRILRNMR
jgi:hypothetical protein